MNIEGSEPSKKVLVVAEIGNNHEGNFDTAQRMIASAAKEGADAVKLQTIIPEQLVHCSDTARLERLRGFQFSFAQFEALARTARDSGVIFFSTPFDLQSARSLEAEQALQQAAEILSEQVIDATRAKALDTQLRGLLGDIDPFWIRWRYVGEKQGWLE